MDNGRKKYFLILMVIVIAMTMGFALLSTNLNIHGTTTVVGNTWKIRFDNIVVDSGNNVTGSQSIIGDTAISFSVNMNNPGDKYTFYVDVVNEGSFDSMINTFSKSSLTTAQSKYLEYTVSYSDGVEIQQKDKLVKSTGKETLRVDVKFKEGVATGDLPTDPDTINLTFYLNYVQADSTAHNVVHT